MDEGSFSVTYKYALFTALLDLCIEGTSRAGIPPTTVTTRQLAAKVVEIYWPQAVPYPGHRTLRQGGVRHDHQAEIVRRIAEVRAQWAGTGSDTTFRARATYPEAFHRLLDCKPSSFDNRLLLKPGVAEHLVRLNGVLRPLFRRAWALMVAGMNQLPQAELEVFLFGADRVPLDAVRPPLLDLQDGRCFYCGDAIRAHAEVEHFVPWSRYVDDGLDNLVVAHSSCNNSKRDFLAAAEHVERWTVRARTRADDLGLIARSLEWPRDDERTLAVARGVYLRLPASVRLWSAPRQFVPCDSARIRTALA